MKSEAALILDSGTSSLKGALFEGGRRLAFVRRAGVCWWNISGFADESVARLAAVWYTIDRKELIVWHL